MKQHHVIEAKLNQNKAESILWKKIGKNPSMKADLVQEGQGQRYETSIEMELVNAEQKNKNCSSQLHSSPAHLLWNKKVRKSNTAENIVSRVPFSIQKVALSQSTYHEELNEHLLNIDQIALCPSCSLRFQQMQHKLKQQINLFRIDYKIMRENLILEMKQLQNQFIQQSAADLSSLLQAVRIQLLRFSKPYQDKPILQSPKLFKIIDIQKTQSMRQQKMDVRKTDGKNPEINPQNGTNNTTKGQQTIKMKKINLPQLRLIQSDVESSDETSSLSESTSRLKILNTSQNLASIKQKLQNLKQKLTHSTSQI